MANIVLALVLLGTSIPILVISTPAAATGDPAVNAVRAARNNHTMMNPIDSCWRTKQKWASNRRALTECAVGFGKYAEGGKNGPTYVVRHGSDNPRNPKPGTLRYGVIQPKPLWITFARDMVIKLKNDLIISSYKTIDGRGAKVEISNGPCITIQGVTNVILHGITIRDCKPGKSGQEVRDSPTHAGRRGGSDGDAVTIYGSSNVWIDHCYFARAADGLIDVIHGSTDITISNNFFTQHDKDVASGLWQVMLFGNNDNNLEDKSMRITVAFNHFGPGLIERMPRVRLGYAHVANNRYSGWLMYAIGGSANPIIFSEGNYFMAPNKSDSKQVTKREVKKGWGHWKWRSSKDKFLNGAYFVPSGYGSCTPYYTRSQSFPVADGSMVPALTADAGPLICSSSATC